MVVLCLLDKVYLTDSEFIVVVFNGIHDKKFNPPLTITR